MSKPDLPEARRMELVRALGERQASAAQRKPTFPVEESGVLP